MTLKDIYDKEKSAIDLLKRYKNDIVNYRLYDTINKKSYVGSSKNIWARMYNNKFGHVGSIFLEVRHYYIHKIILEVGLENFEFYIEKSGFNCIEDAELNEDLLIDRYDSFINGYNLTKNGKGGYVGTTQMYKGDKRIRVKPSEVDKYLKLGFTKGSGKIVLTDPSTGKFKRIKIEESYEYISKGWTKGNPNLNTTGGTVYVFNPNTKKAKSIPKNELNQYLSEGWEKGSRANTNMKYLYNPSNGDTRKTKDKNEIDSLLKSGYKFGVIKSKGLYTMSLGTTVVRVSESDIKKYLDLGYKFGK